MKKITFHIPHSTFHIKQNPGAVMRLGIIVVTVVVFLLFYLVGFDLPYEEDPEYNEPMFTDWVIGLMWIVLTMALITAGWSIYRIIRTRRNSSGKEFGVPVRKISLAITCLTVLTLLLSYLLAGTDPITINGKLYTDPYGLSIATMFIITITILLIVAILVVALKKNLCVLCVSVFRTKKNVSQA